MSEENVAAALYLRAKNQFHILECQALAKVLGSLNFELVGPKGRFECRWLDPTYGIFERIDDIEPKGFHVKQFQFVVGVHCENLEVA